MKKLLLTLGIVLALTVLLCFTAMAAEPEAEGIYGVTYAEGFSTANAAFTVKNAEQTVLTAEAAEIDGAAAQFYAGGVKLDISVSGLEDGYVLILAQDAEGDPTEGNIVYIDQASAASGTVSLTVYPSRLESGKTVHVYIAGGGQGKTEVLSFRYFVPTPPYILGDVDEDTSINSIDALWVLQYSAHSRTLSGKQLLAGDVNLDSSVNSIDALWILQYAAHSRTF